MIIFNLKLFVMSQDKNKDKNKDQEKDMDQQSNPSFTKDDLLGKEEQSEPADLEEQQPSGPEEQQEETNEKGSEQE